MRRSLVIGYGGRMISATFSGEVVCLTSGKRMGLIVSVPEFS